jgi:hypothetical protein
MADRGSDDFVCHGFSTRQNRRRKEGKFKEEAKDY